MAANAAGVPVRPGATVGRRPGAGQAPGRGPATAAVQPPAAGGSAGPRPGGAGAGRPAGARPGRPLDAGAATGRGRRAGPGGEPVVGALQRALDDRAWEVVVEAAEGVESLGALDAGPVLAGLLRHHSEPVRQTAAQALERVADAAVLDDLLTAL